MINLERRNQLLKTMIYKIVYISTNYKLRDYYIKTKKSYPIAKGLDFCKKYLDVKRLFKVKL